MNRVKPQPDDFLPMAKKDHDWHKDYVDWILGSYGTAGYNRERKKDHDNYNIVNGLFNDKEFTYVTNTYGLATPARLVNYPIIRTQLNLLQGEFLSQPLQFSVNVTNRDAVMRKHDEKVNLVAEAMLKPIREEFEKATGVKFEEQDKGAEIPQDIQQFINTPYRLNVEEQCNIGLNHLIEKYDLKRIFSRAFYDILVTSKAFFHVRRQNLDPVPVRIDPRNMIYSSNRDREDLTKSNYVGYEQMLTMNELTELFITEDISKEDWKQIDKIKGMEAGWFQEHDDFYGWYEVDGDDVKVRVIYLEWKSMKAVKAKISPNKYDPEMPFYKFVEDDYKPKKGEEIVEKWIQWTHSAYKVGHDIVVGYGAKPNQLRYEENYADSHFDIVGIIKDNIDGHTLSIVDSVKNVQILFNIVSYHIEVALSRAGGKAIVYDVSQLPKGMKVKDVVHYAKNHGIIVINSAQDGNLGKSFNQFQSVDFGLPGSFQQLITLRAVLLESMQKLSGISDARAGINKASDLVGVNERNVMQSSLITAPYFDAVYGLIGQTFKLMTNKFSKFWAGQEMMLNVYGDLGMEMLKIDDAISMDQYGVTVNNTGKDKQRKDQAMMLLDRYAQSGAVDPVSAVKALSAESYRDMEKILEQGVTALKHQQQAQQQQMQQLEQQKVQLEGQKLQQDMQIAQMNNQTDVEIARMNNQTKLKVNGDNNDFQAEKFDNETDRDLNKDMLDHENRMAEYAMQESVNQTNRNIDGMNSEDPNQGNLENNL